MLACAQTIDMHFVHFSGFDCIITSYDLNPFLANVPQRYLVIIAHLKFWGYGAFYSTLFIVKEMMSITNLEKMPTNWSLEASHDGRELFISQVLKMGEHTGFEEHLRSCRSRLWWEDDTDLGKTDTEHLLVHRSVIDEFVENACGARLGIFALLSLVGGQDGVTELEVGVKRTVGESRWGWCNEWSEDGSCATCSSVCSATHGTA
jgi:hypothetical protein